MMQCRPPRQGGIVEERCERKCRRGSQDTIGKHRISLNDVSTFSCCSKRSESYSLQPAETPEAVYSPLSAQNISLHGICYRREPGVAGHGLVTKGAIPYPQHELLSRRSSGCAEEGKHKQRSCVCSWGHHGPVCALHRHKRGFSGFFFHL